MAQFQTCSSRYLLLGAGIVMMTLLGAAVSLVAPPNEEPPSNKEEEAFERRTLEDSASSVTLNRQNNFKAEEISEIGQTAAEEVLNDLTPEKIAAQLTGFKEMDSMSIAVNKARLASSDASREKIAAQLTDFKEMDSISTAVNKARLASMDVSIQYYHPYYHPTCPEVTIWLRPGYYYWRYIIYNSNKTRTYKYCYNYWYISIIECAWNYCRINYSPHSYFDRRYRCLEEYRCELVPVRCYSFTVYHQGQIVGKPSWGEIEYRNIRLPKDCCCHYYNYYYRDNLRQFA